MAGRHNIAFRAWPAERSYEVWKGASLAARQKGKNEIKQEQGQNNAGNAHV